MYLDEVLAAQKQGKPRGIASICSAHPRVLRQTLKTFANPLIEATCNQVNQFGGYTGMKPEDFADFVRKLAGELGVPFNAVILGGDHLGPHVWQAEPAQEAMGKARAMVGEYVRAGFTKIHLDCSMRLADDPPGLLDGRSVARRAAELAQVAEQCSDGQARYVIGTEVPRPGGALEHEQGVQATQVEDVYETLEIHRKEFAARGLEQAWGRVIAVVVQPGVEFGDDFVLPYRHAAACELSTFIESQPIVYEAHSTDYQTGEALAALVCDHFAILKVGPALTFAYREAIFGLAMIEKEWIAEDQQSHFMESFESSMLKQPGYWQQHYQGNEREQAFKRRFSLSDRARYYWSQPDVQYALEKLMQNVGRKQLPYSLSSQFLGDGDLTAEQAIDMKITGVLKRYQAACGEAS